ncbi:MAG: TCR/Tet family MFS transporter [Myxococcaceae bacterium]|nr:TCR/Tet family MFS transporter [Myxococcaceae bacterium]
MSTFSSSPRRAALVFILITVMLDILALGMIIPVLPKLILSFYGGNTVAAVQVTGVFGTAWALMQFIFSPVQGALSDRFGRRPVVLLSNFGLGLDYILMALAPNIAWLFVGRLISGVTAASISTASAYIADVTSPEKRASAFGMIGVAFGMGFVLGPAAGGLLGKVSIHLPFWVAAGLSLTNAMYGLFVLPESLPADKRQPYSWRRANPIGSLHLLRSREGLLGLAGVMFLYHLAHQVLPAVFVLYAGYRYGWDEMAVGLTLASVGVCSAIVQGALVGPLVKKLGQRRALWVGLTCGAIGFAVYGLAPTGSWFMAGIPVMALWGLTGPSAQGLLTSQMGPSEQGQLQGAISSMVGITGMIGPGLFSIVFSTFIEDMPGAPFFLAAVLLLFGVALAVAVAPRQEAKA